MAMDWKLEVIIIPVSDVDRAKRFYHEQVGFTLDHDVSSSDSFRVVQLTPPGSACSIALGVGLTEVPPGMAHGMKLVVPDIEAARAELVERGVDVTPVQHFENGTWLEGKGGPWNSFVRFSDPDDNRWVIQERPATS